jgi:hypothetical protein
MLQDTFICFIDFEKAFDRVDHQKLMEILEERGVSKREIELLEDMYQKQKGFMKDDTKKMYPIRIGRGVRQGCAISPILFNTYADHAFKGLGKGIGVAIKGEIINRISYADDTALLAGSQQDLNQIIQEMNRIGQDYNIRINCTKTKTMAATKEGNMMVNIMIGSTKIKQVENFTYLGIRIHQNMKHDKDIRLNIEKARMAFLE